MSQLLTSNLWKEAAKLARFARRRQAAIAYVTAETVKFGPGDLLVTDASPRAIQCGETSAAVLCAIQKRGSVIYSCPNLHAKVLLLDDQAIIGSGNMSRNSAKVLEECAVVTTDPNVIAQARAFIHQLTEGREPLERKDLERLLALPVERGGGRHTPGPRTRPVGNRCWLLGITPLEEKDLNAGERLARDEAKEEAVSLHGCKGRKLDWIRVRGTSRMQKYARGGDRVITVWGHNATTNHLKVDAPCVIRSVARSGRSLIFYFDENDYTKKEQQGKMGFAKMLEAAGSSIVPTARMVREISADLMDGLTGRWPKRKGGWSKS